MRVHLALAAVLALPLLSGCGAEPASSAEASILGRWYTGGESTFEDVDGGVGGTISESMLVTFAGAPDRGTDTEQRTSSDTLQGRNSEYHRSGTWTLVGNNLAAIANAGWSEVRDCHDASFHSPRRVFDPSSEPPQGIGGRVTLTATTLTVVAGAEGFVVFARR